MPILVRTINQNKESFNNIVCQIKAMYNSSMTCSEANEAARNLIGFCKILVDYKVKERASQKKSTKRDVNDNSYRANEHQRN